jgi:hypothetical protein
VTIWEYEVGGGSLCFLHIKNCEVVLLVIFFYSAIMYGSLLSSRSLTLQEVHLVRCLTNISLSYFAPGRSLVKTSSANYRDVQQELSAEIQLTAIWPAVFSVDGNISKPDKTDFIDRDGSI